MSFGAVAMQKLDLVSRLQDLTAASQVLNQYMLSLVFSRSLHLLVRVKY